MLSGSVACGAGAASTRDMVVEEWHGGKSIGRCGGGKRIQRCSLLVRIISGSRRVKRAAVDRNEDETVQVAECPRGIEKVLQVCWQ
jgi:hypothetical protein